MLGLLEEYRCCSTGYGKHSKHRQQPKDLFNNEIFLDYQNLMMESYMNHSHLYTFQVFFLKKEFKFSNFSTMKNQASDFCQPTCLGFLA